MSERPPSRRKVTGQMPIAASSSSTQSSTASTASSGPRLKARVNPAGIVSPPNGVVDDTPPARPALGRSPSNFSLRSEASAASRNNSSPVPSSSSRSAVGVGSRPIARAQSMRAAGSASAPNYAPKATSIVGAATTPTAAAAPRARPASVVGGPAVSTPPTRNSPPIPSGSLSSTTGPRVRAAVAGAPAPNDVTPTRVHVRSSSVQYGESGKRKQASFSAETRPSVSSETSFRLVRGLSEDAVTQAPALLRKASHDSGLSSTSRRGSADSHRPPRPSTDEAPRLASTPTHSTRPASTEPSNVTVRRGSHLSSLAQVTPASINLTVQHTPTSSSLLSPSTFTSPLHPHDYESAIHESPEPDPDSNHSSPVRQPRPLGGTHSPVFHYRPQLGHVFGPHATASAPTSPVPHGLALENTDRRQRRAPLPWNPNSTHGAPSLPPAPVSPELRTVALPLMTPTRSRDGSPVMTALGLDPLNSGSLIMRRSSSGSESSCDDSPRPIPVVAGASRGRLSGSTIADESEDKLEAVGSSDVERAQRAKVERKIADLEISNSSLLAINRSLEATKAKQRSEIMRLRRALRENRAGLGAVSGLPLALPPASDDEDDVEVDDPALEARWDRVADLVGAMRRRGDEAIVQEIETRPTQRVLGWLEVEMGESQVSEEPEAEAEAE